MWSPATSGRHLWKFEKTAENDAPEGFGFNFSGAAFYLAQPIGGLLLVLIASDVDRSLRATVIARCGHRLRRSSDGAE